MALQQQKEELERLAQMDEASAAKFDVDKHMLVAEAVQDLLERSGRFGSAPNASASDR